MPVLIAPLWTAILRPFFVWLLGTVVIKALVLTALTALIVPLIGVVWSLLPSYVQLSSVTNALTSIPPGVWWVLDIFAFDYGIKLVLSAVVIRFLIRRIPLVG